MFLLEIDIYGPSGAWCDACSREMLERAKIIYPESEGFRFQERRQQADRRSEPREPSKERRNDKI